jgi:hypothetical protein
MIIKSKKDNSGSRLHAITRGDGLTTYPVEWVKAADYKEELKNDIPKNVIIIEQVNFSKYIINAYNTSSGNGFNLMNSKGEFLLTEKTINYIKYLGNDFFIFYYMNLNDKYFLYYYNGYRDEGMGANVVLYDLKLNKKYNYTNLNGRISRGKCTSENCLVKFSMDKVEYQINSNRIPYKAN